jgi:hypothetical protein
MPTATSAERTIPDVDLTRALERGQLASGAFRHADHLRVGWVYLSESPTVDAALERMAATLRRFAASVGRPEKYSDAVTAFWIYQLAAVRAMMPHADCMEVLRAYPRLLDKTAAVAYYSPDAAAPGSASSSSHAPDRPVSGRSA